MPINESTVMKARLAEWISENVTVMNEKKRENVMHTFSFIELLNRGRHSALWKWRPPHQNAMHFWEKTGLLAILDVNELASLVPKAFADTSRFFTDYNTIDDSVLANEQMRRMTPDISHDFSCAIITRESRNRIHNYQRSKQSGRSGK